MSATKKTPADKTAPVSPAATAPLPLFYQKPTLIDVATFADKGLNKQMNFEFAAKANAVPLNLIEFPQAAHFYPIAFARDAVSTPVAIMGVRDQENLFVGRGGQWTENVYVPAYVRRYPFILSETADSSQLSLCIDDVPGVVVRNGGDSFFDADKQPTQMGKNAIEFCRSYHMAAKQTAGFGEALMNAGLLVDRSADITLQNGQKISFSGFRIIDEEKFNKMPEATLIEWRQKGWLAGAYAHLFSGLNWGVLTRMVNERVAAEAQKPTTTKK